MDKPLTIRRFRAVCDAVESQAIIDALVNESVPDSRGFGAAARRVAEFLAQHAAGGRYASLYPAPSIASDAVYGEHDPFIAVGSSLVFDVWQFDYGDEVHGHIMCVTPGVEPYLCVTPTRHARLAFLGTCSRRPASTFDFDTSDEGDDNLAAYIFDRDNTAITGWVLAFNGVVDAAVRTAPSTGHSIGDPVWWRIGDPEHAPGDDIVHDATTGDTFVEATYIATVNPGYLGT